MADLEAIDPKGDFWFFADTVHSDNVLKGAIPLPQKLIQVARFEQLVLCDRIVVRVTIILNMIVKTLSRASFLPRLV